MKAEREERCRVYVDMGTTNTRVWIARGDQVIARAAAQAGVRDTAREGSPKRLRSALGGLIGKVRREATLAGAPAPECVVAAGMIGSPLGLTEVPHIEAPAGLREIAAAVERHSFPEVSDLPFLLVPGVRSGPPRGDKESVTDGDVMRGEETLCLGLLELGYATAPATILNLGSHWKAIELDRESRISSSRTSLSGEMLHAVQTQTILASSVPQGRASAIDEGWVEAGMREERQSGLARALFCVRLLEQRTDGSKDERLAFVIGAFIAADLDALVARGLLSRGSKVWITGGGLLARAWQTALATVPITSVAVPSGEAERALVAGLRALAERSKI